MLNVGHVEDLALRSHEVIRKESMAGGHGDIGVMGHSGSNRRRDVGDQFTESRAFAQIEDGEHIVTFAVRRVLLRLHCPRDQVARRRARGGQQKQSQHAQKCTHESVFLPGSIAAYVGMNPR